MTKNLKKTSETQEAALKNELLDLFQDNLHKFNQEPDGSHTYL